MNKEILSKFYVDIEELIEKKESESYNNLSIIKKILTSV